MLNTFEIKSVITPKDSSAEEVTVSLLNDCCLAIGQACSGPENYFDLRLLIDVSGEQVSKLKIRKREGVSGEHNMGCFASQMLVL